jgi:hypothetical protein
MSGSVRPAVTLLIAVFLLTGCARVRALWIAPYERGADVTMRPAPETGVYKVKWSLERDGRSFGLDESSRIVRAGEPLGFGTDENGRVFALAGRYEMPLENLHPEARFCVWSCKLEEPTEFALSMEALGGLEFDGRKFMELVLEAALDSLIDDDDEDVDDDHEEEEKDESKDRGERYRRKADGRDSRERIKHN